MVAKGKTHPFSWKSYELRIARRYGVGRNSKKGQGHNTPDVIAPVKFVSSSVIFSIECKLTQSLSKQVQAAIAQSKRNASNHHVPIAILKEKHSTDDSSIVCMDLVTFDRIVKKISGDSDDNK